jgi:predicted RNA-binding Zn-ribbon protein involved in translation (DUF1610 family)
MAPPSSAGERYSRHRKKRRSPSILARIGRIWRGWWTEILVATLALLAIFLLVEQMDIRKTLFSWLRAAMGSLEALVTGLAQALVRFVGETTLSDLVAYVLLAAVVVLIGWRTRYRLLTSPRLSEIRCPQCGSDLHRIHRRWRHRVLNLIIPVRRYRCANQACGWQGLRVRKSDH